MKERHLQAYWPRPTGSSRAGSIRSRAKPDYNVMVSVERVIG